MFPALYELTLKFGLVLIHFFAYKTCLLIHDSHTSVVSQEQEVCIFYAEDFQERGLRFSRLIEYILSALSASRIAMSELRLLNSVNWIK